MAIPFDATTLQTSGTATPILDRVADYPVVSSNGTLAYLEGDNAPRSELVFVARDGRIARSLDSTWRENFATLALSNDGQRLVELLRRLETLLGELLDPGKCRLGELGVGRRGLLRRLRGQGSGLGLANLVVRLLSLPSRSRRAACPKP